MLYGVFVILVCQLVGEAVRHVLSVPVPGPVIGILLVMVYLAGEDRAKRPSSADRSSRVGFAADGLLGFLGLLFVPAGVGIAQSFDLVLQNGVGILVALVGSTVLTLLATVAVFRLVRLLQERRVK